MLKGKKNNRQRVLPGIVSPRVFIGYHSVPFKKWMESDLDYIKNKSLLLDLFYLLRGFGFF
ncbi:MAG: hypothetical protein ABH867_01675 [Patescibacteria group bacterium]|nr:sugar transferase [Patescibacteria group bacterium]